MEWDSERLVGKPDLFYFSARPSVEDRRGPVPAKDDDRILSSNGLFLLVHTLILAGPLAPHHRRPIGRLQRSKLPIVANLMSHNQFRFPLSDFSSNRD